jgi:hypothetical protein
LGIQHRNHTIRTRNIFALVALLKRMNERTSLHKQRAILTRTNQLQPTRHYVHYAQTNLTNCTPKDIYAQRTSNQSRIVMPAPVSVERKRTSLSNFEGAASTSQQGGLPWAHTVAVRIKRPLAKHAKPFGGANASSRNIQFPTFRGGAGEGGAESLRPTHCASHCKCFAPKCSASQVLLHNFPAECHR